MPDETIISEIESLLSEIISLGGQNEQSKMVPNLTVQVANPGGLDGFVIVSDNRDGDNILAKKVPSVIYTANDLVNVMFLEGGEAIAFQQGSQSSSGGIWEIVPSTSTDIFYNKGDVGIGKSIAPDAALEVLDTTQAQLRLTHTEDSKFVDLTLDTNHDLTITPSSTGQVIIQPTTDQTDSFQILDADGGIPTLNADLVNERIGIGIATPTAKLHIDQSDATGAIPPILLDQGDVDQDMIEFATTIGTGNAIEASGLKLLTPTHFVKVTLPGALTRYIPVGTIGTTGPTLYKSQTVTTQGLGANPDIYAFGFYEFSATDANLDEGTTTQTFGTANISYAAHAFAVTGGAGSTDAGVVGLRVNGTSINDQGTRTPADTETIIADITAVALDDYQETSKKWLGTVTYELFTVSGVPTVFSLDFNYGLSKYDDWGNNDFTITDIEAIIFAGNNDADFDIKLMHHQSSGWSYSAAAFTPITAANTIVSLAVDHSTDDQLASNQHSAWKRDNLSTAINGADSEGFLIFISSTANNAIEYLNLHVGVVF